jgi:hypothetical protein
MITCYFGKLGQGKTYALAEHAIRELEAGRIVYANFFINWQGLPARKVAGIYKKPAIPKENFRVFKSVEEFLTMENAFVALDEGWIYFDSYEMTRFPIAVRMKILQSRKDGLDLAYTTQRPEQVHLSLRAMTNEYYECEAGRVPFIRRPVFYRYECDIVGGHVKRNESTKWEERKTADGGSQWIEVPAVQRPKIIWPSNKVFKSFDTSEKIALPTKFGKLQHAPIPVENIDGIDKKKARRKVGILKTKKSDNANATQAPEEEVSTVQQEI